jgi:hypothetical protein
MRKNLHGKTLGIIHTVSITPAIVKSLIDEILPEVKVLPIADDSIQRDLFAAPTHRKDKLPNVLTLLRHAPPTGGPLGF